MNLERVVRSMVWRRVAIVWTLVAGVALAQTPITQVRLFVPSAGNDVIAGMTVSAERAGACFSRSLASPERPDAYRCTAEDTIHDPCFRDPVGNEDRLVCASGPLATEVIVLTLAEPLPAGLAAHAYDLDLRNGRPWTLELEDGRQCGALTGATALVAGMRVDYGCNDGTSLVGPIDRSSPTWRIFAGSPESGPVYERMPVAVAWF
jgi:hypothetical protein